MLASAGPEAGYVARSASLAAAFEIAVAAAAALMAVALARRRASAPPSSALAIGVTLASCALFGLANGALPFIPDRTSLTTAGIVAVGVSLGAGWLLRPARADRPAEAEMLLLEPPLLAGGFFGAMAILRAAWISPASARGLAVAFGGLASGLLAAALLRRLRRDARRRLPIRVVGVACLALLVVVGALELRARESFPRAAARSTGRPDVLLVVLDTARADAVPQPAGSPFATPALARLAREGTSYTSAFSTSCWTLPSHASLFTGLLPREHGAGWESPHLPVDLDTLAAAFSREGYRTAGFSANVWVSPEFGFDRGFDRFMTVPAADRPFVPWPVRVVPRLFASLDSTLPFDDKGGWTLASEAERFLGARDERPAFVFLNLLEAHMPYQPPERYVAHPEPWGFSHDALVSIPHAPLAGLAPGTGPSPRDLDGLRILYAAEIAYDDALVAHVIDRLREAGRLDRTIVVIASDHGENLGAHPPLDHQLGLWDSLAHVPLIVRFPPRIAPGVASHDLVSLVDVRALVFDLAGVRSDARGGSLLAAARRDAVFLSYDRPGELLDRIRAGLGIDPTPWDRRLDAIRTTDAKWIEGSDGSRFAYDLARDPDERINLAAGAAATPPGFEALAARLHDDVLATPTPAHSPRTISDETRRKLRSLGYVR